MQDTSLPTLEPFPTKPIAACAAVTLALLGWLTWSLFEGYRSFEDTGARLHDLAGAHGSIVHLDEVLTMSATMAAVTGESRWIERYRAHEPQLAAAIDAALHLARSPQVARTLAATNDANVALVRLEQASFDLVLAGRAGDARALLESPEYTAQKDLYAAAMAEFGAGVGTELRAIANSHRSSLLGTLLGAALVCAIILLTWALLANHVRNWHATILRAVSLEREATTDALTGVANVRSFHRRVAQELQRQVRTKRPLTLLVLDADHFKRVNDTYGHDVGDQVLKVLAQRWGTALRNIDFLARVGGEEFAVILPETDIEHAKIAADRLCRVTREEPIPTTGGPVSVTVSIGISAVGVGETDASPALKRADRALYDVKGSGRDHYVVAAPA